MAAVACRDVCINILIEKGADLEIGARNHECSIDGEVLVHKGMRVVHIAASEGRVDIACLLLQAGANPNSTDYRGSTPLMVACMSDAPAKRTLVVEELLKGGADPALSDCDNFIALHMTAGSACCSCDTGTINTLLTHAPATLNHAGGDGITPLGILAQRGLHGIVSHLLSAGASNRAVVDLWKEGGIGNYRCPLGSAVSQGHEDVVSILLDDGFEAVGGLSVIPQALLHAVDRGRPKILQMLISVEGEKRRPHWARVWLGGQPVLHLAAAYGNPGVVRVLLAAGADETVLDGKGQQAREVIGASVPDDDGKDAVKEAAICRALERGPAFRAQSWTWLSRTDAGTHGGGAAGSGGGGGDVAPLSIGAPRAPLDVRVLRPRHKNQFAKLVGRYSQKQ